MKLTLATLTTALALALATGASAMVGPYERAVNDASDNSGLITTGLQEAKANGASTSPQAEWNSGETLEITVFSTNGQVAPSHFGVFGR